MPDFNLVSNFPPAGDQPKAIKKLTDGIKSGLKHQTLLGVTGSGKTFNMANVIANVQKPTLIISHNKTLAAQLYSEFLELFPNNAVEYFVSYYDYYQPEAYVVKTDTYIGKEVSINEEIEKLRNSATSSILSRKDVIVVASVSCIYGLGSPSDYSAMTLSVDVGEEIGQDTILKRLVDIQYKRNDMELTRGKFRVRGDVIEVFPAYANTILRIELFGDQVERIREIDPIKGSTLNSFSHIMVYPAKHFVSPHEKMKHALHAVEEELEERLRELKSQNKLLEAQRLEQRTRYDLEMLREIGYCSGVENYSRHLLGKKEGEPPYTLLDYFPKDYLMFIDESHRTIPQIGGMYKGDRSRKETLVEYGFRLPSALDNRPLKFTEFNKRINQVIYVSATPEKYEIDKSKNVVEQIIRPTGLVDPIVEVRPTKNQIDDLLNEINKTVKMGGKVFVTTLTKRMAENIAEYFTEVGVRIRYLHSDIDTLLRIEIIRDLRLDKFDVLVGINLLREGLDVPEVALVGILDADKQGYLRSKTSLIQTIGRASRNVNGRVIMYADKITTAIKGALKETERRRNIQIAFNKAHGITPKTIIKEVRPAVRIEKIPEIEVPDFVYESKSPEDLIIELEIQMKKAAENLEFEKAAILRDQIKEIKGM